MLLLCTEVCYRWLSKSVMLASTAALAQQTARLNVSLQAMNFMKSMQTLASAAALALTTAR